VSRPTFGTLSILRAHVSASANFHEKALFVKVDVATPSCASATALCPSLCFHPHF
jgi:hypothetical protein